jgi:ABC-type Na+ efflux pump permease subunit
MYTGRHTLGQQLRIIWAIAAKDILDAIRSRTTLSILVLVPLLLVVYKWLPSLYNPSGTRLVVYGAETSAVIGRLEADPDLRLYWVTSMDELAAEVTAMPMSVLGVVWPGDGDEPPAAGEPLVLAACAAPWTSHSRAARLASNLEERLSDLLEQPVHLDVQPTPVYPTPDSMGPVRNVAVTLTALILLVAVALVPHLMLEERQTQTLDVLLVSPASAGQVVAGKALAGAFYGLLAAGAAFTVNPGFVAHWGLALLATLAGVLLGVSVGLLLGSVTQSTQALASKMIIVATLLLGPVFLNAIEPILPQVVQEVLRWVPTVAVAILFRTSFAQDVTAAQVGLNLGLALGTAVLVLGEVAWQVRRASQ